MHIRGPMITQSEATAAQRTFTFPAVDATDGYTPETAHTYAGAEVEVSKNGGAFATSTSVVTQIGTSGVFACVVDVADLDTLGEVLFKFADASSRTVVVACQVVALDLNTALTAAGIADAVCDEALSGHTTDGSVGEALGFVEGIDTSVDAITTVGHTKTRSISMAAAAGDFVFDGADTGLGYSVLQAVSGKVTVTGTWDGATATLQSCADPLATVPSWATHGTPLTADGTITITAPVAAIRLVTSAGGGTTELAATALVTEPR